MLAASDVRSFVCPQVRPVIPPSSPIHPHIYLANDIVPQEFQHEILYWRDVWSLGSWRLGDIGNQLIKYAAESGFAVTQQQVFDAIGFYADKRGRTIRYYAETAAFFSMEVRQEFDVLPFSKFVVARSFGTHAHDVLEFALDNPFESADRLRDRYLSSIASPNQETTVYETSALDPDEEKLSETSHHYQPTSTLSPQTSTATQVISNLANLSELVTVIERLLTSAEWIPREAIADLRSGLRSIRQAVMKIASCNSSEPVL